MEKELIRLVRNTFQLIKGLDHSKYTYKSDGTVVTKADKIVENYLVKEIKLLEKNACIIGEENEFETETFLKERYWLIDPIDGTSSYSKGQNDYTVNVALIERGYPVFGIIGHPPTQKIWYGFENKAFLLNKKKKYQLMPSPLIEKQIKIITSRNIDKYTNLFLKKIKKFEHLKESSSIKFCRLANGLADIYPRFQQISKWDIAAGDAILRAAGGRTISLDGKDIKYKSNTQMTQSFIALANIKSWNEISCYIK